MLLRIVRMEFRPEALEDFEVIFRRSRHAIRSFPGCLELRLYRDQAYTYVRYTYSHWQSPEALEAYRASVLFAETWAATKVLFAAAPQAYSLMLEDVVELSPIPLPDDRA